MCRHCEVKVATPQVEVMASDMIADDASTVDLYWKGGEVEGNEE